MISIFIDGDNCPNLVLDYTIEFCKTNNIPLKIVADRKIENKNPEYEMVVC